MVRVLWEKLNAHCTLVQLDKPYEKCNEVQAAIEAKQLVLQIGARKKKKLVVPKNIIFRAGAEHMMYSSYEHESISRSPLMRQFGNITTDGIDTLALAGQVRGECSVLMHSKQRMNFARIIMSTALYEGMNDHNKVVVYPCGERRFFCALGNVFLEVNSTIMQIQKEADFI